MTRSADSTKARGGSSRASRTRVLKPIGPKRSPFERVPDRYRSAIYVAVILLALLAFFSGPILSGDLFVSTDFLSWESFRPYLAQMQAKGELPLWIPHIFSGMPGFAALLVTGDRWWDLTMKVIYSAEQIVGVVNYPVTRVVLHYFIYGIGMYFLMRSKRAARSTALFVSLAAIFSTWVIIYVMIGHNTKILVLMTFPYIFMCLEKLIDRWSLLYAGLLIIAVHVLWEAAHMQTAFYGACAIAIYLLFELIAALVSKDSRGPTVIGVLRAGALVVVAAGFTYAMGIDRAQAVAEYLPYSTRGVPAIAASTGASAETDGHGYEYATAWSFSPQEMITFVISAYYGWGTLEYTGPETNNVPTRIPSYWGQMPHTDAAHYAGIAVLILSAFGAWTNRRQKFVQALMVIGGFGLLLSFGSNLPILYDLFFKLVPKFSSFRAPSQSLVLLEFALPILAGFGIESLIAMRKTGINPKASKTLRYSLIGVAGFALLGIIGPTMTKSSYLASVASVKSDQLSASMQEFIFSTMASDWLIVGLLGTATMALMYYYVSGRITSVALKMALLVILVVDLWRVDFRSMETKPKEIIEQTHGATDIDAFLNADTSKYRIIDVRPGKESLPNSPAYQFHEHVMGYHAAKLRAYQDFLDFADNTEPGDTNGGIPMTPVSWALTNTKYVIYTAPIAEGLTPVFASKQKPGAIVYVVANATPRAWFVNRIESATPRQILEKIRDNSFDPREVAYVDTLYAGRIDPVGYVAPAANVELPQGPVDTTVTPLSKTGSAGTSTVAVTHHEAHHITLEVNASGNNFFVISEMCYPPGWRASIDGKPANIIRTDYILRGLVVPAGKHVIQMEYIDERIASLRWVSLAANLVAFGMIAGGFVLMRKRQTTDDHDES